MPFPLIETARLHLRPYRPGDIDALHRLWIDPDVRRYLLDDEVVGRGFVIKEITDTTALFEAHSYGQWTVWHKGEDALIGFCGYRPFYDPPDLQLIYGIHPAWWGRGFASEAAHAALRYGFETLGFETIRAATDVPNTASVRVLEKIGMTLDRRALADGLDTLFFSIRRDAFMPGDAFYQMHADPV